MHDELDDIWEFAEHFALGASILCSLLEYLSSFPDPPGKKQRILANWRGEVGLQLGNPQLVGMARDLFQTVRAAPREKRISIVQSGLSAALSKYFANSGE